MIKFNVITMKDGEINIEEKPELSELLSQSMENHAEFTKTKKERAMDLPEGFYKNDKNLEFFTSELETMRDIITDEAMEFFTSELETMRDIITDEAKLDKVMQRMGEGAKFGTFRRYKTQQPFLVKAYKTRKGADQNTFWRNH